MRSLPYLLLIISWLPLALLAQTTGNRWKTIDSTGVLTRDSLTRGEYTLVFINKDSSFSPITKQRMTDAFFTVYPQEALRFNPNTLKKVIFIIDPAYKGVAATGGGVVRYNPAYLKSHPNDIDVVTHEVMHVVQAYGRGSGGPGWLTEGIADYVRYKYGVDNAGGNWSLPKYDTSHAYTKSYRVTARFLAWLEKNKNPTIVDQLDASLRAHTYTPDTWKQLTGNTLDELWKSYAENPSL